MEKKGILFKEKQLSILLALRDSTKAWSISELAKSTGTTYAHACNFIISCEKLGITSSEKHGKLKEVKLSEKGRKIADVLTEAKSLMAQSAPEQIQAQQKTTAQQAQP